jgi:hypothetical protein
MNHLTNLYKHKCEQLQEQINNIKKQLNEVQLPPGVIGTDQHGPPSPDTPIYPIPEPLPGNPFDDDFRKPKPGATPEQMMDGFTLQLRHAMYQELRNSGMTHEQAIEAMKDINRIIDDLRKQGYLPSQLAEYLYRFLFRTYPEYFQLG